MDRREFLAPTPATVALAGQRAVAVAPARRRFGIEPRQDRDLRLPGRSGSVRAGGRIRSDAAREFYLSISNDDILHGHREAAGLPAPGAQLGGWCGRNSNTVFGQWLSGMSRLSRATGDAQLRDKAVALLGEYAKTLKADGDAGMRHYPFDKLVCGLVDLQLYADHAPAAGCSRR